MKKSLKILAVFIIGALLLLTVGLAAFLYQFDASEYKDQIEVLVEEQTGRDFAIRGTIRVAPSLVPTLAVEDVTFANPDWASQPHMLSVGRLEARFALLPLLAGNIELHRIDLLRPVIHLQMNQQGRYNWQFGQAVDAKAIQQQSRKQSLPHFDVHEISIKQADITYQGPDQAQPLHFNIAALTAESSGLRQVLRIELNARFRETPLAVKGSVGSLAQLGSDKPYPLTLNIEAGAVRGRLEGHIENPSEFSGIQARLQLQADTFANFNQFTGQDWPSEGPLKLETNIRGNLNKLEFESLAARFGDSDLQGQGSLALAETRPKITATLHSDRLNLLPYQPEEKKKQKDKQVFSSEKFNLTGLQAIDADISLKVQKLQSRQANIAGLNLSAALEHGVLTLKSSGRLADGSLDSDIRLDAAAAGPPKVNVRLDIKNMLPEQLPVFAEDPIIRDGRTDIHFDGRGAGSSPAAVAANLDGKLLVTVGRGQLLNNMANLAGSDLIFSTIQMLNPLAREEDDSDLICGVLNFDIDNGVAQAKDGIALQTSKVNVLGNGVIDLKTEQIDFRAKPKARQGIGLNLAQLGDVVHIGGTLSNPRPVADVGGALKTAGTVGAAVATGGLSLLAQGVFSRTFSTDDPCAVALGEKSPDSSETAAPSQTQQDNEKQDKNALEKAGDAAKGIFNGLFGQ